MNLQEFRLNQKQILCFLKNCSKSALFKQEKEDEKAEAKNKRERERQKEKEKKQEEQENPEIGDKPEGSNV